MQPLMVTLVFSLWLGACSPSGGPPASPEAPVAVPAPVAPAPPAQAALPGPEIVMASSDPATVQAQVVAALGAAARDSRQLVVYVGATWCEPCRRFHDAIEAGRLDARLAGVRFLEFDHDVHHDGLQAAGYLQRFVPLFAIPEADGSASARLHQGAVKGPGAVDFILPHLEALLRAP
ncbi:MAG: thioredoxin [Myxococcota bacterium]|nr:thioredoxin [Myxococcota bacterium]